MLLFLISNSGVAVSAHWCGGKLASINLFTNGKQKCKCCKKTKKPKCCQKTKKRNCCKNEIVHLKANDELAKTNPFAFKVSDPTQIFPLQQHIEILPIIKSQYSFSAFYHPPQFKPKIPIYLLNEVLLI